MLIYPNMYHQKSDYLIEIVTDMTMAEREKRDKQFLSEIKNAGWTLATKDHFDNITQLFDKLRDLPDSSSLIQLVD